MATPSNNCQVTLLATFRTTVICLQLSG